MFIKQLQLINFQSHVNSTIDLHPNFNVLVGTGNHGKSSIVRALSFILFGQWENSWIRHNQESCKIILTTDTNIVVTREKGSKVNKYIIQLPNEKEQVYENFGVHVPVEVETVLQIFKAQIDLNEFLNLNISSQMDSLFLLSKTGSYRAKVFGKLSGAHYLDYTLRELNKDKKNASSELQLRKTDTLDLQKQLIDYENVEQQKERVLEYESKLTHLTRRIDYVQRLKNLFTRVSLWKASYTQEIQEETLLGKIDSGKLQNLEDNVTKLSKLKQLFDKIKIFKETELKLVVEDDNLDIEHDKFWKQYKDLLLDMKECPICTNSITEDCVKKIMVEL